MTDINKIISDVVSQVPDEQVMSDLDATVAWAGKNACGNLRKFHLIGLC
jgi:carboxymethylenebutenolidase